MIETLLQISGPGFTAGLVARDGRVIEASPILRRNIIKGMSGRQVAEVCRIKRWTWVKIHDVIVARS